jgi:myo-inositol-1(or 4)-monophosphatase
LILSYSFSVSSVLTGTEQIFFKDRDKSVASRPIRGSYGTKPLGPQRLGQLQRGKFIVAEHLAVCERAARAGGAALLQWVGRIEAQEKGPSDLVTQADLASQEAISAVLGTAFPRYQLVSEEGETRLDPAAEYAWVVDPLDGTTNYVHQFTHYAVSIALVHRGRPVVGVVLDPVHNECFSAERGGGAYLNGRRITTSSVERLADTLAAASFAAKVQPDSPEVAQFVAALLQCQAVRRTGSAALNLCYVAAGRFDAFWALSTKAWDVAAGALLVEEAGGTITCYDGRPLELSRPHPLACATSALHERFQELLKDAPPLS